MFQIDNTSAAPVPPTVPPVGPNPGGYFTDGNPATSTESTVVPDWWLNLIQMELINLIIGAGLTPSKTDQTQVLQAISLFVQSPPYAASASPANTYTATMTPAPVAYTPGMQVNLLFTHKNTGAATINLNALGPIALKRGDGTPLFLDDIKDNMLGVIVFDGVNFQLINPATYVSQSSLATTLSNYVLASTLANYVLKASEQNSAHTYVADTGTVNAYAAILVPAIASYVEGLFLKVKIANTNTTTTPTINVNAKGIKNIKLESGAAVAIGDLPAGGIAFLTFDGTQFQLLNPATQIKRVNTVYITSSGTYTRPPGLVKADVEGIGGGAGGGGAGPSTLTGGAIASGGGAGAKVVKTFTAAQIGASQSVTIGAAGLAGANTGGTGGNGGDTTFGALLTASGGTGGGGATDSPAQSSSAGLGGVATGGDININGGAGGCGFSVGTHGITGFGGASQRSGNANGQPINGGSLAGAPGLNYGGGGSGAGNSGATGACIGGPGAPGLLIVTEYLSI